MYSTHSGSLFNISSFLSALKLSFPVYRTEYVRVPAPGFKRTYRSVLLGRAIRVRATLGLQRKIERLGGFDRYIYYSPPEDLQSRLAIVLRRRMTDLVAKHPSAQPPPLDKRNPKPLPKRLTIDIPPVEVCDMSQYVYLG